MSEQNVEAVRAIYARGLLDHEAGHRGLLHMGLVEYVNPEEAIDRRPVPFKWGRDLQAALEHVGLGG